MKQVAVALAWVLPFFCFSQYTYQNLHVDFMEHSDGLKVNTYANLRLYPVYATDGFRKLIGSVGPYTQRRSIVGSPWKGIVGYYGWWQLMFTS
jgi:hypothetical protein